MPQVASLDTNLVVRLFVTSENPSLSEAVIRSIESNQVTHIADLAVNETVFVLHRHYGLARDVIAKLFQNLFNNPKINCNVAMLVKAFGYFTEKPALSFEDCCLAVYAEFNDALPLLTNDHKLAKQLSQAQLIKV